MKGEKNREEKEKRERESYPPLHLPFPLPTFSQGVLSLFSEKNLSPPVTQKKHEANPPVVHSRPPFGQKQRRKEGCPTFPPYP